MKEELEKLCDYVQRYGGIPDGAEYLWLVGPTSSSDALKLVGNHVLEWSRGAWTYWGHLDDVNIKDATSYFKLPPWRATEKLSEYFQQIGKLPEGTTHFQFAGAVGELLWSAKKLEGGKVSCWTQEGWAPSCAITTDLEDTRRFLDLREPAENTPTLDEFGDIVLNHVAEVFGVPHDTLKAPPEQKEPSMTAQDRLNAWVDLYGEVPPDATHMHLYGGFADMDMRKVEGGIVYYWNSGGKWMRSSWSVESIEETHKDKFVALENGKIRPPQKETPPLSHAELRRRAWVKRYGCIPKAATHLCLFGGLISRDVRKVEDGVVYGYESNSETWVQLPAAPKDLEDEKNYMKFQKAAFEANTQSEDIQARLTNWLKAFGPLPPDATHFYLHGRLDSHDVRKAKDGVVYSWSVQMGLWIRTSILAKVLENDVDHMKFQKAQQQAGSTQALPETINFTFTKDDDKPAPPEALNVEKEGFVGEPPAEPKTLNPPPQADALPIFPVAAMDVAQQFPYHVGGNFGKLF